MEIAGVIVNRNLPCVRREGGCPPIAVPHGGCQRFPSFSIHDPNFAVIVAVDSHVDDLGRRFARSWDW